MWPRGRPRVSIDRYEGFVFAAAALAEDVDLDVGRRKEILFADAHLARWSHWEVLDHPWNAPAAAAKAAYLEKAKLFHPDRYAGRRLGSYRARLERIFRKVTAARDVLGDEAKRAAYAQASASPEEFARREARRLDDERRAEERRARLARHNPLLARTARVTELVRRGKAALAEGRFGQAANDLIVAQGLDPQNAAVSALAAEARKKAAAAKGLELFRNGLEAEALGNASAALASYREAIEADPANARAAAHGARTAAQLGDAAGARALVDGALRTNPRSALVHEALGIVLELEGNKKDARRAFERALELDPKLDSAKERLKKLRWGFLG
jgi:tetratricopeptide (TPR) repeat protein